MSSKSQFRVTRYVLVARDAEQKRVAVLGTPRLLTDLAGLLKSMFVLNPVAVMVDVVLPWPADQRVDDQEVLVSAERYSGDGPVAIIWYKARDLRAIEQDIAARAVVLADAELEVSR
jgi:hypothetical protein